MSQSAVLSQSVFHYVIGENVGNICYKAVSFSALRLRMWLSYIVVKSRFPNYY